MKCSIFLIVAALSLLAAPARGAAPQEKEPTAMVPVTGVLVGRDGSPVGGRTVFYVFREKETNKILLFHGIRDDGTIGVVLSARTKDDGHFTLDIPAQEKGAGPREFELGLLDHRGSSGDVISKVTIEEGAKQVDLGNIVVEL